MWRRCARSKQHEQQPREEKVLSSSFPLQLYRPRLGLSQAPRVSSAPHAHPSPAPPSFFDPSTPTPVKLGCFLVLKMSANAIWTAAILEQRKINAHSNPAGLPSAFSLTGRPASRADSVPGPHCTPGFLVTDFGLLGIGCRTRAVLMGLFLARAVCPEWGCGINNLAKTLSFFP